MWYYMQMDRRNKYLTTIEGVATKNNPFPNFKSFYKAVQIIEIA